MLKSRQVSWGADPEGFFHNKDQIVGSERLVPKKGMKFRYGSITRDGVQFELHPNPGTAMDLCKNVGRLVNATHALANEEGYGVHYGTLVEITQDEFNVLSPSCRVLDCTPSYNIYGERPLTVDPTTYPKRSAAGHIHVGLADVGLKRAGEKLVALSDALVGNTCVMLDRDPGAAERRENYGRAGECRFPKHGVEYRTISNFWLRDPALMLFTFGLMDLAVAVLANAIYDDGMVWRSLGNYMNIEQIQQAINTNDFKLAQRNFIRLLPFFRELPKGAFTLDAERVGPFLQLATRIGRNGMDSVFAPSDMTTRWTKMEKLDLLEHV